ncbi:MAG: hypothetical protein ACK47B_25565 [Armatimonadota bacterium]
MSSVAPDNTPGLQGTPELDELQRSRETPVTVETLERLTPPHYGQRSEIPVPDPGERPGAIRPANGEEETENPG